MFTDIGKKEIVDRHNELRRKIAKGEQKGLPAAADMEKMVLILSRNLNICCSMF